MPEEIVAVPPNIFVVATAEKKFFPVKFVEPTILCTPVVVHIPFAALFPSALNAKGYIPCPAAKDACPKAICDPTP